MFDSRYLTELYESICAVPVWQYEPSICTHGHEVIAGLPGSNNTRQAPNIILVIMCVRCLFVELNIVADSRVYGNLNLSHRGRVMHILPSRRRRTRSALSGIMAGRLEVAGPLPWSVADLHLYSLSFPPFPSLSVKQHDFPLKKKQAWIFKKSAPRPPSASVSHLLQDLFLYHVLSCSDWSFELFNLIDYWYRFANINMLMHIICFVGTDICELLA